MASDGLEWEQLIDALRPLGDAMRARVPEGLRGNPQIMAESMRLLLSGFARASSDALVGDRRHPMFVPELNVVQNVFLGRETARGGILMQGDLARFEALEQTCGFGIDPLAKAIIEKHPG